MEKIIYITDEDRRGKTPDEAFLLLVKEVNNLPKDVANAKMILPGTWSWAENPQLMQRNMYELASLLVNAVGERFLVGCHYNRSRELSITVKRYVKN